MSFLKKINWLFIFFIIIFIGMSYYVLKIETEKYKSWALITIKDLSEKQSITSVGSLILGQGDVKVKSDSELLTLYIKSFEMYKKLDKDFNLTTLYSSKDIDPVNRLYRNIDLPYWRLTKENLLRVYNKDIEIIYNDLAGTLYIAFYHPNPKKAKAIVSKIINYSSEKLNEIDRNNNTILVKFFKKQEEYYKNKYISIIKKIISFQNRIGLIDPNIDIKTNSELLASLKSDLIRAEVELQTKKVVYTNNSPEVQSIKKKISKIKEAINKVKRKLTGSKSRRGKKLNQDKFRFEVLKNELEFNKELYRQALLKLEEAKLSVSKMNKNVITITSPILPELYSRPNKLKDILTIFIILFFLYGIIKVIVSIIKEHKD